MEISGDYVFDAPREMVWKALLDPNVLGAIMPGGKGFEQTDENQYKGVLEVKVGPVQGTFQGVIKLLDIIPPERYQIEVDGKGPAGFVKASGKMQLETRDSQTFMQYSGQAQVGGRIASVGQRLMDSAARSIIRQSLEALNEYLKIEVAKQAPPPPVAVLPISNSVPQAAVEMPAVPQAVLPTEPKFRTTTQTMVAVNVARDIVNDFVPARYHPWLIGAVVLLIVFILWLIFSR
jgi:uncharacterized protein